MGLSALIYLSDSFRARWKNIYPVTLSYRGNVQPFFGLWDTGNFLVDPISQKEVFIIKPEVLEALLPQENADRLKHLKENPGELEGTEPADLHPHFLPYKTIGEEGVLLAVVLDDLCIHTPRGGDSCGKSGAGAGRGTLCFGKRVPGTVEFQNFALGGGLIHEQISKCSVLSISVMPRFLLGRQGEVYYIGGSDILPPPLETQREARILEKLGTPEEKEAKSTLIEHNLRLVVYIAKKFDNTGVSVEDLISIGTIGLIKAINTFNPVKNIKLATYASRCIENEILMYLRRNSKTKMEVSIDEPLNVDWDGNELLLSDILGTDDDVISQRLENEVEIKLLGKAISKLSPREQTIIKLRFGLGRQEGREKHRKKWRTFWEFHSLIFPGWKKGS